MNLKAALNTKKVLALVLAGVSAAAILGAAATPVHAAYTNTPRNGETEVLYRAGSQEGDEETNWLVEYPVSISLNDTQKDEASGYGIDVTIKPLDATKNIKISSVAVSLTDKTGIIQLSGTTSGSEVVNVEANVAASATNATISGLKDTNAAKTQQGAVKVWITETNQLKAWNKVQYKGKVGLTFTPSMT